MRWSLLIAVFGLSIADVPSFAQGRPDGQRPSTTSSTPEDAGFFASKGVVRFQLIQGRLCLDAPRHRKGSQNREDGQVYESITVTAQRGIPSLHYVYQAPQQHLTLSVQQATAMRLESFAPETGERSILEQPAVGEITWTHRRGDLESTFQGATLLHLRCSDPVSFDHHFGAIFARLLRGQSIGNLCRGVDAELLRGTVGVDAPELQQIERYVWQLRSSKRSKRLEAEQTLLEWGTPIVSVIQSLSPEDLDPEQRERIRHILKRLRPRDNDTSASLARLLINDQQYWSLIADHLSPSQLVRANNHLHRVGLKTLQPSAGPVERIAAARD
ncbi:MAG: hypothetical protein AAGG48_18895 [Planctomycetota bacterium]